MPLPLVTSNISYAPSDKIISVFITIIVLVIAVQVEQMYLHVHKNVDSEVTAHVWLQSHTFPVSPQHYHQGLFITYHGHPDKYSKASGSDILANICDLYAAQPPQPLIVSVFMCLFLNPNITFLNLTVKT